MAEALARDWFDLVPKVELHLHLEGAIPLPVLWELVCRHGGDPEVGDPAALAERFRYRDFDHFIRTWVWKNRFLRTYDDFTRIAAAVARELVRQRVRYAEVFYSPLDFRASGLGIQGLTTAIRRGLDQVPEVEVALILDLVRDFGPEEAQRTLAEAAEVRGLGVIGICLGGSERAYPAPLFAAVFAQAHRLGLRTTAHAGEADGPASVRAALERLGVERIGHGVRAIEDPAVVAALVERRIPLEICPTSNVCTGVVPGLAAHPITALRDAGVVVTVGTDDPAMFGCTLAGELRLLERVLGWSRDEVRAVILAAVASSWLPPARRSSLAAEFTASPAWVGADGAGRPDPR